MYSKLSNEETKEETKEETRKETEKLGHDIKICIDCKKKDIDTILVIGKNITKKRYEHSQYICDECYKERQDKYRQERWSAYKQRKIEEMVTDFTKMWNDLRFSKVKVLTDKIVGVFDAFDIRSAERGFIRDVLCMVIFPELWFVEADKIINDMLNKKHLTMANRLSHKEILLQYIPENMNLYMETYRNIARDKWDALVHAVNTKFDTEEKLIGTPRWEDPFTHLMLPRWRLLSDDETLNIRKGRRAAERENSLRTDTKEEIVVDHVLGNKEKTINEGNESKAGEQND